MRDVARATGIPYTTLLYRWKGIVNHFKKDDEEVDEEGDEKGNDKGDDN